MERNECDEIVDYIAAIYGLRIQPGTKKSWHDQLEDLPATVAMGAVREVMRAQETRGWPLISRIRALASAEIHPGGISPRRRSAQGCGRCHNGIVLMDDEQGRTYGYRCRCAAGQARPEKMIPLAPAWACGDAPPDRKSLAGGDTREQPVQTAIGWEGDLGVPF